MRSSVVTNLRSANGRDSSPPATVATVGLDVLDAAYHTAHDHPGGVPALAVRMAMSENTLAHKVSLTTTTHHLSLRESVTMQEVTGDVRILHAMAGALGYACINMRAATEDKTLQQVMHMAKEFGEVLASVNDAVADGRVTPNEMQDCERHAAELMAATNAVLVTVRNMMPKAPTA
jgi:hypothetical protein